MADDDARAYWSARDKLRQWLVDVADEAASDLATLHTALAEANAEIDRLRAGLVEATNFVARTSGTALGIAMSGEDHPNPDEVLMDLAHDGIDLSTKLAALLNKKDATHGE